jgi:hypothetical protein
VRAFNDSLWFYFLARASTHLPSLWYMKVPHDLVAAATFAPLLFLDAFATFFLVFFLPAVSSTLDSRPGFAVGFRKATAFGRCGEQRHQSNDQKFCGLHVNLPFHQSSLT